MCQIFPLFINQNSSWTGYNFTTPTIAIAQEIIDTTLATEPDFKRDYAAIIDEDSFEFANDQTRHKRAIIAGWIDGVRLIDNMKMGG